MWTSVADLFTPTSLFLFLNLTIAAIAITSRKNNNNKHPPHASSPLLHSDHYSDDRHRHLRDDGPSSHPSTPTARALERASSLFKSMNSHFSPLRRSGGPDPPETEDHGHHHLFADDDGSSSLPASPMARGLERASSLLKSINHFSPLRRSSGPDPPETEDHHHHHHLFADDDGSSSLPASPMARGLERASSLFKSMNHFSPLRRSSGPDPPETEDHHHLFTTDDGSSSSSSPASSLPTTPTARALERASSIFKSLHHFSSPLGRSDPEPGPDHLVKRSGAAAAGGGGRRAATGKMTKSASEKCTAEVVAAVAVEEEKEEEERRRPATVRLQKAVSIGDDHGVDSKADDFINRFKQQLKLQRLDSLLRNRELLRAQQQQHS
ncbi:unnamed protein product [Linum tenue]|uniref:DUF4408 domain-containing protein n=1 Tax=Linum tenue TaxID=586396 RepID=A0AAV0HRS4_9ROSI|nr:unnamed protein product [Linum tenue]